MTDDNDHDNVYAVRVRGTGITWGGQSYMTVATYRDIDTATRDYNTLVASGYTVQLWHEDSERLIDEHLDGYRSWKGGLREWQLIEGNAT
jgi:hypothetical protein